MCPEVHLLQQHELVSGGGGGGFELQLLVHYVQMTAMPTLLSSLAKTLGPSVDGP